MRGRAVASLARGTVAALLAAVALVGTSAAATGAVSSTTRLDAIRAMDPDTYEQKVQHWINEERERRGLRKVQLNTCTDRVAENWSEHLASTMQFYHQSLDPLFDRCNATYGAETLARGAVSPRQMVQLWMDSDGHRRILTSKYPTRIGLGATLDERGDWLVAADFIRL